MLEEIQRVNSIDRHILLKKCPKIQDDSVTALYIIFIILISVHGIIENSPTLKAILPKPPCVAFCNPKR